MSRAIRFTSAAILAVVLSNTSLNAIDLGNASHLDRSSGKFEDIVNSSKQEMFLLNDTAVKADASDISASIASEAKGSTVNVLEVSGSEAEILTSAGQVGYVPVNNLTDRKELIFNASDLVKYAAEDGVEVKNGPSADADTVGTLNQNDQIQVTGTNDYDYWRVETDGFSGYVRQSDMMDQPIKEEPAVVVSYLNNDTDTSDDDSSTAAPAVQTSWNGAVLTPSAGTITGPSGKETYYNLDMSGCVSIMRGMGNTDAYWVRSDGVKMLGDYVMVAASLNVRPRGSLVATSLGTGIVVDTGGFAASNPTQLDIAVAW